MVSAPFLPSATAGRFPFFRQPRLRKTGASLPGTAFPVPRFWRWRRAGAPPRGSGIHPGSAASPVPRRRWPPERRSELHCSCASSLSVPKPRRRARAACFPFSAPPEGSSVGRRFPESILCAQGRSLAPAPSRWAAGASRRSRARARSSGPAGRVFRARKTGSFTTDLSPALSPPLRACPRSGQRPARSESWRARPPEPAAPSAAGRSAG